MPNSVIAGSDPRIAEIISRTWKPDPEETSWEWAAREVSQIPYSPVPGGFDPELVPAIKPIMEAIDDPRKSFVCLCMSVQSCKSLALELSILAWTVRDPGPTMLLLPQGPEAADQMTMRLRPLMDHTPPVKELIPTGKDRDLATKTRILFNNSQSLWVLGSHPRNLQRRSLRRIMIDEAWQWEPGRIAEAMARTTAFGYLGKVVLASQGSESEHEFATYWEGTNRQEWTWRCKSCGQRQPWSWNSVKFETIRDDDGNYNFPAISETVHMICRHCEERYDDCDEVRRDLNAEGKFVVQNPAAPESRVGFHLNAISTMSWATLVYEYLTAKKISWAGDFGPLKLFHMKRLASFFTEATDDDFAIDMGGSGYKASEIEEWQDDPEQWEEGALAMMGGRLKAKPGPASSLQGGFVRLRFLCVDVQRDHFFAICRSFTADGRSRLLFAGKLISWEEIMALQKRFEVIPALVFVDCGDTPYSEEGIYTWCSRMGWVGLRGDRRLTFGHKNPKLRGGQIQRYYSPKRMVAVAGKGAKKQVRVHHFSALNCRDILQRLMGMPDRWELPDDLAQMCPEYEAQLSSQRRVKMKNGNWTWKTINQRVGEHLADCEVMACVAGLMCKVLGAEEVELPDDAGESGEN